GMDDTFVRIFKMIQSFPNELQIKILTYVVTETNFEFFCALRTVCKKWNIFVPLIMHETVISRLKSGLIFEFDWNEIEWSENSPPIYDDRTKTFTFAFKPVDYDSSSVIHNYNRSYDYIDHYHAKSKLCVHKRTEKQTVVDYYKPRAEAKLGIEFSSTVSPTFTSDDNMCEYKFDSQNSVRFKREIEVDEEGESISHVKLCGLTITAWKLCYVLDCLQVNG
ncbi:3698_t:CDS:2, partial [Dentiscutata erythropus]